MLTELRLTVSKLLPNVVLEWHFFPQKLMFSYCTAGIGIFKYSDSETRGIFLLHFLHENVSLENVEKQFFGCLHLLLCCKETTAIGGAPWTQVAMHCIFGHLASSPGVPPAGNFSRGVAPGKLSRGAATRQVLQVCSRQASSSGVKPQDKLFRVVASGKLSRGVATRQALQKSSHQVNSSGVWPPGKFSKGSHRQGQEGGHRQALQGCSHQASSPGV
jgi:hypothetical protein